jgi:hypothetical protein
MSAPSGPQQTSVKIHVGATVQINGLVGNPEHNGTTATVEQYVAHSGRWVVKIASGKVLSLKPHNLNQPPSPAAAEGMKVPQSAAAAAPANLDGLETLTVERQEMVTTLMAVAGIEDDFAREILQDNGWQLESSVNAYMMIIGEDDVGRIGGGMSSSPPESPRVRPSANQPPHPATAEGMQVPHSAAAAAPAKLDYLFPPPRDIVFPFNFDDLCRHAAEEEKYCLVNIQKRQEFASQMLNRDTWADEDVRTIMGFRFVFWQQEFESSAGTQYLCLLTYADVLLTYADVLLTCAYVCLRMLTYAGMQYLSVYPSSTLPVVDIIDPITGGLLMRIEEYQSAEQMVLHLTLLTYADVLLTYADYQSVKALH